MRVKLEHGNAGSRVYRRKQILGTPWGWHRWAVLEMRPDQVYVTALPGGMGSAGVEADGRHHVAVPMRDGEEETCE